MTLAHASPVPAQTIDERSKELMEQARASATHSSAAPSAVLPAATEAADVRNDQALAAELDAERGGRAPGQVGGHDEGGAAGKIQHCQGHDHGRHAEIGDQDAVRRAE